MASSTKGVSAHQLHRSLGLTYKTAWFIAHRIHEPMRSGRPARAHDFRYLHHVAFGINDEERSDLAIKGAAGKRLTHRQPHGA